MSWSIKGNYAETCSCELMCPCNLTFDHGATYDYCRFAMAFHIREGNVEGTDVSGLKVGMIANTPKVMTDGNWKVVLFVDENASDEQAETLAGVMSGALGGPMAALGPLVGELIGPERVPIEFNVDGVSHTVRIGDVIDFQVDDIIPFGKENGEPVKFDGMFHPVAPNLTMAEAKRSNINAFGIAYEGKSGLTTPEFSWAA